MSQPAVDAVELIPPIGLRLVEVDPPYVPAGDLAARDAVWDAAVRSNPSGLFDGPAIVCVALDRAGPQAGSAAVTVSWARVTYRQFAMRRVPGAAAVSSVFVAVVQPTIEGGVTVGRASAATAGPGRLQLPGGTVEPPEPGEVLDVAALARHAARELAEETGVVVAAADLRLWVLSRGEHGNVGVFFRAPVLPRARIGGMFTQLVTAEAATGREPEFTGLYFPGSQDELAAVPGPRVDYLAAVIGRHAGSPVPPSG